MWHQTGIWRWVALCTLLLLSACTSKSDGTSAKESNTATTAKTTAPVTITAKLDKSSARLAIEFEQDVRNAKIKIWGVDGLTVMSDAWPVQGGEFSRNKPVKLMTEFVAPSNYESELVVGVTANFGGRIMTKVQSFVLNEGKPRRQKPNGLLKTDDEGAPVRVMKGK